MTSSIGFRKRLHSGRVRVRVRVKLLWSTGCWWSTFISGQHGESWHCSQLRHIWCSAYRSSFSPAATMPCRPPRNVRRCSVLHGSRFARWWRTLQLIMAAQRVTLPPGTSTMAFFSHTDILICTDSCKFQSLLCILVSSLLCWRTRPIVDWDTLLIPSKLTLSLSVGVRWPYFEVNYESFLLLWEIFQFYRGKKSTFKCIQPVRVAL